MLGIKIKGTGKYLPERVVTNDEFSAFVETSDEWIITRTGIKQRHIATDVTTTYMGVKAAQEAIAQANVTSDEIDMIIVSTVTGDYVSPSTACLIAHDIGAYHASCMDINCACAGFVYALDLAYRYLADDTYKNILIVSAEMLSKITDYTDRSTCVLFGDGAGACVVSKDKDSMFSSFFSGDASGVSKLFARGAEPQNPFRTQKFDRMADGFAESKGHALYMDGREVYKFATKVLPVAVINACERAGISPEDIDLIIPHQANIRIVETAAKNLKLPIEKFFINIQKYGNMSSACIPICLNEAVAEGRIKPGSKVCMVGFGAGLTYGAAIMQWQG